MMCHRETYFTSFSMLSPKYYKKTGFCAMISLFISYYIILWLYRWRFGFRITVTSWRNTWRKVKQNSLTLILQLNARLHPHHHYHPPTTARHSFPRPVLSHLLYIQTTPRGRVETTHPPSGRPCFRSEENHHIAAGIVRNGLCFRYLRHGSGTLLAWVVVNVKNIHMLPR